MNRELGITVLLLGVVALNYVYLHDMIWQKHDGFIVLGWKNFLGVMVSTAVLLVGAGILFRSGRRR